MLRDRKIEEFIVNDFGTPSSILFNMIDLIETTGWCQGTVARDSLNRPVKPSELTTFRLSNVGTLSNDLSGISFSIMGALLKVEGKRRQFGDIAILYLRKEIDRYDIQYWNDEPTRTKEEVLNIIKIAANKAKLQELSTK